MSWRLVLTTFLFVQYITVSQSSRNKVLLISFDGFRHDFDEIVEMPKIKELTRNGVKASSVTPAFPTLTLVAHMSLATGLYPESHGVIHNYYYDPETGVDIHNWFDACVNETAQPYWDYGGEPIWITAEKNGLKSAVYKWCGGTFSYMGKRASFIEPLTHYIYNKTTDTFGWHSRIDGMVDLLHKSDIGLLYFEEPDDTMHYFGINSTRGHQTMEHLDEAVGYLMSSLKADNLLKDKVNIIITSDHGHTTINNYIPLFDYVNKNDLEWYATGALVLLFPKKEKLEDVYKNLTSAKHLKVYQKKDFPSIYHFAGNHRVAPIIAMADIGYTVYGEEFDNSTIMSHGYDNKHPDMKSAFYAYGPDFKKGYFVSKPFHQVDIYSLICKLLNIPQAPNNGSLLNVQEMLITDAINASLGLKTCHNPLPFLLFMLIPLTCWLECISSAY